MQDGQFTLDGRPAFLLGCSYYGALAMDDAAAIQADLDDVQRIGFNWIRVWAADAEELRFLQLLEQEKPMSERAATAGSGVK